MTNSKVYLIVFLCIIGFSFAAGYSEAGPDNGRSSKQPTLNMTLKAGNSLVQLDQEGGVKDKTEVNSSSPATSSSNVKVPLSDDLKAFFSFGSHDVQDLSDDGDQHFRALFGINIAL